MMLTYVSVLVVPENHPWGVHKRFQAHVTGSFRSKPHTILDRTPGLPFFSPYVSLNPACNAVAS